MTASAMREITLTLCGVLEEMAARFPGKELALSCAPTHNVCHLKYIMTLTRLPKLVR